MGNVYIKKSYIQGETIRLKITIADAVKVYADINGDIIDLTATDAGIYETNLSTKPYQGDVRYTIFAENAAGDIYAMDSGAFFVRCSSCSNLRNVVKKIDEAIETWGTNPNKSLSVGEINITYKSLDELLAVRAQYMQRINEAEQGTSRSGGLRNIGVCFV